MSININKANLIQGLESFGKTYTGSISASYTYSGTGSTVVLDGWFQTFPYRQKYQFIDASNSIIMFAVSGSNYPLTTVADVGNNNNTNWGTALFMPDFLLFSSLFPYSGSVTRNVFHTYEKNRLKVVSKNAPDVEFILTFSSAPTSGSSLYKLGNSFVQVITGTAKSTGSTLYINDFNGDICFTVCSGSMVTESWNGETFGFVHGVPGRNSPYTTDLSGGKSHLVIRTVTNSNDNFERYNIVYKELSENVTSGDHSIQFYCIGNWTTESYITNLKLNNGSRFLAELGYIGGPFTVMANGTYTTTTMCRSLGWTLCKQDRGNIYTDESASATSGTFTMPGQTQWVQLRLFDKHYFITLYSKAERTQNGTDIFERHATIYGSFASPIVGVMQSWKALAAINVYQEAGATASLSIGDSINPTRAHISGSWSNFTRTNNGTVLDWTYYADNDWRGLIGENVEAQHQTCGAIMTNITGSPAVQSRCLATSWSGSVQEESIISPQVDGTMASAEQVHYNSFTLGHPTRGGISAIESALGSPTILTSSMISGSILRGQTMFFMPAGIDYCLAWDNTNGKYIVIDATGSLAFE